MFDDFIFVFFALEMSVKMIAMGVYGRGTYLADSWNRLDFFIVLAGYLRYTALSFAICYNYSLCLFMYIIYP